MRNVNIQQQLFCKNNGIFTFFYMTIKKLMVHILQINLEERKKEKKYIRKMKL